MNLEGGSPPNGTRDRLNALEQTGRDQNNRLLKLERDLAGLPYMAEDIREIRMAVKETREWVENREKDRVKEIQERDRLSTGQRVAIIGGVFVLLASLISAIATLAGSGAFG